MACRYGKLPLNDSPRTLVFRCVDDILRADPVLRNIFAGEDSFRSWQGRPSDMADFAQAQAPAIRITPIPDGEQYWHPGQMKGFLSIKVDLLLESFCVDDVENLFYAIQRALVPSENSARLARELKLKDSGAMLGQVQFTMPAYDPTPEAGTDGQFRAVGMFKIEVRTT